MAYLDYDGLGYFKGKLDNTFANQNGTYDNLTAGNAEQLLGTDGIEDKVPYVFRKSGGVETVGDREKDKLVGGTIAWNQHLGNMATSTADGITTSYNSATNTISIVNNSRTTNYGTGSTRSPLIDTIAGHKYIAIWNPTVQGVIITNLSTVSYGDLFMADGGAVYLRVTSDYDFVTAHPINSTTTTQLSIIDLTQMFGTAVADHIYTIEQATPGAGVALFRSMFPKPYYAYNAGTLLSVNTSAHEMVGFNQWDEEWELGAYNESTGQPESSLSHIRSKNYIRIDPSLTYYLNFPFSLGSSGLRVVAYDADKNITKVFKKWSATLSPSDIPSSTAYMRWSTNTGQTNITYNHDICINIYNASKNGTYEPYKAFTYPLDSSLTLRGIPKLDANNKLYYDGDTYESDGTVTRRYGIVDLGTLAWVYNASDGQRFVVSLSDAAGIQGNPNLLCAKYVTKTAYNTNDKSLYISSGKNLSVWDSSYTDAATFKTAMSGVYLVYELATPTTESAEPYQNPQIVDPYGTEEYVDAAESASTPTRDVAIPVGHDTFYPQNLRKKIENLPWDLSMLAPIENGATASQAYEQGKYFMRNNQFCKAKTSIASGATFTLGTNYEVTTVGAELYSALNA